MSELGQNEGQGQNEKATFFDSAKISEKKDVEHFSNVEGAEERAKAAERARKAAEKEAAEVHAADVRAAAEQMKKAEDKQAGKKGGILGFLFGGWHKIVTIAIICILVFGIFALIKWGGTERAVKSDEAAQEYALDIYRDINKIQATESLSAAREKMESVIDGATSEQKVYLSMYYAEFLASKTGDEILAREWLEKAESFCKNEKELTDVRSEYANIAMIVGNKDFDIYRNSEGGRDEE